MGSPLGVHETWTMPPDTMLSGGTGYDANTSKPQCKGCIRSLEMSTIQVRTAHLPRRDQAWSWASGVQRLVTLLLTWQQRAHDRRQLQSLNDHMLRDIGLTRADVFTEASKPFWRP
jgi:uncharacterized protein YjiS (DUF1127 family)